MQKVGEIPTEIMIITVITMNSTGFKSNPVEFKVREKETLKTILCATRALGLYNPTSYSTEDGAVIGFGFYGHHKKVVRDHHKVVYDGVSIIYDHTKGSKVHDFADFASVVGELLKL